MEEQKKYLWSDADPRCLFRFVLHHIDLVLLAALIGAMLVSLLMRFGAKPTYSSSTTFAVTARSTVSTNVTVAATQAVSEQLGELLQSDLIRSEAAKRLGLSSFPATVSVRVPEKTNIIIMTVQADSPETAYQCALAIIETHSPYSSAIFVNALLDPINGPTIPTEPNGSAVRSNILLLSAPLFAAAMVVLLIAISLSADKIQTVSGAKHKIDGTPLATIRHERRRRSLSDLVHRRRSPLLITDPTCSFYYTETVHRLRARIERDKLKNGHRVFVVTSCGENEGKSTVAANLALSLAQKHRRVLLIDADLRKPSQARIFGSTVLRNKGLDALLTGRETDAKACVSSVRGSKLGVLFAQTLPRRNAEAVTADSFRSLLAPLREEFGYIVIDTPPLGFFADAEVIADAADASLLVVRQDSAAAIDINDAIDTLTDTHCELLGYVLNDFRTLRIPILHAGQYGYGYGYGYGHRYNYDYGYAGSRRTEVGKEDGQDGR